MRGSIIILKTDILKKADILNLESRVEKLERKPS